MNRTLKIAASLSLALFALAACAGHQPVVVSEPNILPENYKPEILAFLRTYLNDPTKIRGAFISEPALKAAGSDQRYAVCLRFNAKKSSGEYEGSNDRIVYFLAGKLDVMVEAKRDQCGDAAYKPFLELERLTR